MIIIWNGNYNLNPNPYIKQIAQLLFLLINIFQVLATTCLQQDQLSHNFNVFICYTVSYHQPDVYHLNVECLPIDSTCEQNISIITQQHTKCWALIIDPLDLLLFWFKNKKNAEIVCIKVIPNMSIHSYTSNTSFN